MKKIVQDGYVEKILKEVDFFGYDESKKITSNRKKTIFKLEERILNQYEEILNSLKEVA